MIGLLVDGGLQAKMDRQIVGLVALANGGLHT